MNAAIYCRKSTDEPGRAKEQKSVERQQEAALEFASKRGWTVPAEFIYVDDDVSGAEFKRRPDLQRLLTAAGSRAPFQFLIVSEQKSLGRETIETPMIIKRLAMAGVEIFEYDKGQSLTPKNYIEKMMTAFRAGADEAHREDTAKRVREAHTRSVKKGHVVGGRIYGYRNRKKQVGTDIHGTPLYSHTERVIEPTEEKGVVRCFELFDTGHGLKVIARLLTEQGVPPPIPFIRKDPTKLQPVNGWSPSTVGAILAREMYHGVITWNRSQKRPPTAWGEAKQTARPKDEWMRVEAEHLRIVDEQLWKRVQSRRKLNEQRAVRVEGGRLAGPPPHMESKNLLAGLATCAHCGGGLIVETSPRKRGRVKEYLCGRHRYNAVVCSNAFRIAVVELDEAILQTIEEHALTPDAIEAVIQLSEQEEIRDERAILERERQTVAKGITNLTAAIERDGVSSLIERLRTLENRRVAIEEDLRTLRPVPRLKPQVINDRLEYWRKSLRGSTTQARAVIQRLIVGRIKFTLRQNEVSDDVDGYEFEAATRFDRLFTGIAVERPRKLDPMDRTGLDEIRPEDTRDAEYSQVLEQAYRKSSVVGSVPNGDGTFFRRWVNHSIGRVGGGDDKCHVTPTGCGTA